MKPSVPALAPILRSNTQGDLLAALFLDESQEWSLAELERHTGANPSVIHREIDRLARFGAVVERRVGRARLTRANPDYELWRPLSELVLLTYGPKAYFANELRGVREITEAYIYGSWAARYHGEVGRPPQDVDLLVIGNVGRDVLVFLEATARVTLRRDVNITRAPLDWRSVESPFFATIRERPLVSIPLSHDEAHS